MKVILTTTIKKLGKVGDTVTVKPGFARNFLFHNNMALRENKKNIEHFEKIREEMKKNDDIKLDEAKNLIEEIKKKKSSLTKKLMKKINFMDQFQKEIIDYLNNNKLKVKSDDLIIKSQIKSIGEHKFIVSPYEDISEEFSIIVNKN